MNRALLLFAAAAASLVLAAPASTHMGGPVLIIRHQTRGCHTWGLAGGTYKASQSLTLEKGVHLISATTTSCRTGSFSSPAPALRLGAAANLNSRRQDGRAPFRACGRVPLHHEGRRGLLERDQDDRRRQRPEAEGDRALVGRGLAAPVVADSLDVVAVRVEDEGAVVALVVDGSLAGGPLSR